MGQQRSSDIRATSGSYFTLNMLGRAKKVMIDKENTTIVSGAEEEGRLSALDHITSVGASVSRMYRD
jgi:chaperonin GroEL